MRERVKYSRRLGKSRWSFFLVAGRKVVAWRPGALFTVAFPELQLPEITLASGRR
jgi:hypothetical protein